jgi:hypothetical protein
LEVSFNVVAIVAVVVQNPQNGGAILKSCLQGFFESAVNGSQVATAVRPQNMHVVAFVRMSHTANQFWHGRLVTWAFDNWLNPNHDS